MTNKISSILTSLGFIFHTSEDGYECWDLVRDDSQNIFIKYNPSNKCFFIEFKFYNPQYAGGFLNYPDEADFEDISLSNVDYNSFIEGLFGMNNAIQEFSLDKSIKEVSANIIKEIESILLDF